MVRIPVAGKSDDQIRAEIRAAAWQVCGAAEDRCIDNSVADAERQLDAIVHVKAPLRQAVDADGALMMRVSIAGKTQAQVRHEIDIAAHTVCQPTAQEASDYRACVGQAISDAQHQLSRFTLASADIGQLAQN